MNRRELLRSGLVTAAALPVLGSTTGCATLLDLLGQVVKKPDISFRNFKINKTTLSSFNVSLDALLKNPNPFGFRMDGLDWIVNLAGGQTAKGKTPKGVSVKARGTSETQIDLDFDLAKTAAAIMQLIEKRKIPLGIEGVGHLRANKYKFNVPAKFETILPMPQIPDLTVPRFAVQRAGLSGIVFSVEPLIKNSNGFDLDIDQFDFDVKIGGKQVLRNKTMKNLKLQSNKSRRVPFELEVDLATLGLTAAKLATSPRFDWEVGAGLKSGPLNLPFTQKGRVSI